MNENMKDDYINELKASLLEAIKELESSGYCFDHPSLCEKRSVLDKYKKACTNCTRQKRKDGTAWVYCKIFNERLRLDTENEVDETGGNWFCNKHETYNFQKGLLEKLNEMAQESLDPDNYMALIGILTTLSKTRKIGWEAFQGNNFIQKERVMDCKIEAQKDGLWLHADLNGTSYCINLSTSRTVCDSNKIWQILYNGKNKCTEERPCIPCYTDNGICDSIKEKDKKDKQIKVLEMITEYFGNQGASIAALADTMKSILKEKGEK